MGDGGGLAEAMLGIDGVRVTNVCEADGEVTFLDLDESQRVGITSAEEAVQVVRAHLGPRYVRDVQAMVVDEGFVGRG